MLRNSPNSLTRKVGQNDHFGRWTVTETAPRLVGSRPRYALCECLCGVRSVVRIVDLQSGKSLSCGCLQREMSARRLSRNATFRTWAAMWRLALRRKARVCESWKLYPSFERDMGLQPEHYRLVRIDETKEFSSSNCRWSTKRRCARSLILSS